MDVAGAAVELLVVGLVVLTVGVAGVVVGGGLGESVTVEAEGSSGFKYLLSTWKRKAYAKAMSYL